MKVYALALALLLTLPVIGCSAKNEPAPQTKTGQTASQSAAVRLEPAFQAHAFTRPVGIEFAAGSKDSLFVVEQPGRVLQLDKANPDKLPAVFLDIRDRVHSKGNEQGLLGLAFHPDYLSNGFLYVNYTTATHTVISRFQAAGGRAETASEQVLLTFEQPFDNHNGGQLSFGPDGYLYIATGDGGSGGDPLGSGQNLQTLLGKMLRIDVSKQEGSRGYAIPPDNPFVGRQGAAPEIYAYGLRNPWRFSFDPHTGALWAADVGQNEIEEINRIDKGGNYGWNVKEGKACYKPASGCDSSGLTDPVWEYEHGEGNSITGGYVYRGSQIPAIAGWYVYADFGSGRIWALREQADGRVENRLLTESGLQITSFGVDAGQELYLCTYDGRIRKLAAS